MKLRNLFMAVIAGAALLTGCNKEVDLGPAKIEMSTNTLTLSQGEASQAITFTATRDWVITGIPDWIAVSAEEGVGSPDPQKVTVSVNANSGFNRRADLIFTIGFARQALTIIQEGPSGAKTEGMGTKTDPYTVAGVKEYIGTLDGATSPVKVYIKGKISAIKEEFSAQYGNGNFTISEDGSTTGEQFTAYRVLYLGNAKWKEGDTQIKVGDEVVLYGNVVLYNGTYETSQGNAFLYELNGVNKGGDEGGSGGGESVDPAGDGSEANPFNVAAAIAKAKETGETATADAYYIKGKVAAVSLSAQYKNGDLDLVDVEGGVVFKAYRIKGFNGADITGNEPIVIGDEVVICGNIVNFMGNTPETTQGGKLVLWNGKTSFDGGGDQPGGETEPAGDGSQANPFNVAAAVNAVKDLTWTDMDNFDKVGPYYVKGKISSIKYTYSAQYGTATFNISDDGTTNGAQFTCYSVKYYNGEKWVEGNTQVNVGDEVVIYGELQNYQGNTPETVSGAYVVSIGGGSTPGGDTPGEGDGSQANPFNVAQAVDAVKNLTWTDMDNFDKVGPYYVKGTISSIKYTYSAQYGTATFNISDDGTTESTQFTCYSVKYYNGEKWVEGNTQVAVGDKVVIYGELQNYQGNTPETVSGAYVVSINADEPGGGDQPGGDTPGGETVGIMESNVTMITGTNAYDDGKLNVTYNGQTYNDVKNIKFGKSSAYGNGSVILPAGTVEVEFFAIGWKGQDATLQFTVGETVKKVNVTANEGAANTSPYNVTVTDSDHFTVSLGTALATETTVKVETVADVKTGYRAFLFGVHANKTSSGGGDQPGGDTPGGDTPGGDEPNLPVNDGLTEATAFTVQDAIYVAKNGVEDKEYYVKAVVGKDITIKNGTASFELLDGTTDGKLTVVKAKSFEGADFDGTEPLEWLDEVILKGKVTEYSTLPALLNGIFVKWNGKAGFKEPDPDFTSIASLNALATSTATEYTGTLENAVISFVPNTSNAIIKDATGSTLLYLKNHGLKQGQTFSGKTTVKVVIYNGAAELTAIDAVFAGDEAVVAPEETTLATIAADFNAWQSAYVKVGNLEVTAVNGKNISVKDGDVTYIVYSNAGTPNFVAGDIITATGTICQFSSVPQIKAWTLDAIEVKQFDFNNIAALNALATSTSTEYTGILQNAVVAFVPNANNAIIKDASGSTLLYKSGHGLKQGQTFSGKTTVKVVIYNGAAELTAIDAAFTGDEAVVAPQETTLATIAADFNAWQSAYVKVGNLEVTAVNGKNISVKDGDVTYIVYSNAGTPNFVAGDIIKATGTICQFSSVPQIKAWTLDAIELTTPAQGGGDQPGDEPGGGDNPPSGGSYVKVTTAPTDWSGTYLLVNNDGTKAFSGFTTSGTIYGIGADVTSAEGVIAASDAVNAYQLVIAPATVTDGAYTIKFGDKYLNWTSGNSLTGADAESANTNWNISIDAGSSSAYIVNAADANRKIRWNSNSPRFATYTSAQTDVQLYKLAQ